MAKQKRNEKKEIKSGQNWSVKYRPEKLEDFKGNSGEVDQLKGMLKRKKVPSAILISGKSGTGKTTLARVFAREVNGRNSNVDIKEINTSDQRGIDDVRKLAEFIKLKPFNNIRFVVLDEVHKLTEQGANALLKPLEEPPSHSCFILCTNHPEQIITTIKNRCQKINLQPLDKTEIKKVLTRINKLEKVGFSKEQLEEIAKNADGIPRDAIQIFEKVYNIHKETGDFELSVKKAFRQVNDHDLALKALIFLYTGDKEKLYFNLKDVKDEAGFINLLIYKNNKLLDSFNKDFDYDTERFFNFLKKKKKEIPSFNRIIMVSDFLYREKRDIMFKNTNLAIKIANFI